MEMEYGGQGRTHPLFWLAGVGRQAWAGSQDLREAGTRVAIHGEAAVWARVPLSMGKAWKNWESGAKALGTCEGPPRLVEEGCSSDSPAGVGRDGEVRFFLQHQWLRGRRQLCSRRPKRPISRWDWWLIPSFDGSLSPYLISGESSTASPPQSSPSLHWRLWLLSFLHLTGWPVICLNPSLH